MRATYSSKPRCGVTSGKPQHVAALPAYVRGDLIGCPRLLEHLVLQRAQGILALRKTLAGADRAAQRVAAVHRRLRFDAHATALPSASATPSRLCMIGLVVVYCRCTFSPGARNSRT